MDDVYRKLNADVIHHLTQTSSWPAVRPTELAANTSWVNCHSGQCTALRNGRPVLERFALGWIRMLIENKHRNMEPIRRSLCRYLGRPESSSLAELSTDQLADLLLAPPVDWRYYAGKRRDFLMTGVYSVGNIFVLVLISAVLRDSAKSLPTSAR